MTIFNTFEMSNPSSMKNKLDNCGSLPQPGGGDPIPSPAAAMKVNPFSNNHSSTFHDNLSHQNQLHHFQNMLKTPLTTSPKKKIPTSPFDDSQSTRQLLPVLVCLITFATVLSVLIIYMDTTEIRHQQFRLNMTRDYDLVGVNQDDPELITYVRDIYLRRYSSSMFKTPSSSPNDHKPWDYHDRNELTPRMARYVADGLLNGKRKGVFVQSLTGSNERLMTAQWLAGGAQWTGVIVEPELRKYFEYRKAMTGAQNGVEVVHACVSPNEYPKEVDWRREAMAEGRIMDAGEERDEVKINSLLGDDDEEEENEDTEAGRVKCFSLFTLLLATNRTTVDLLSLGTRGQQLQILQTLPFDRVDVKVISLHFAYGEDNPAMMGNVMQLLYGKGFEFVRKMGHNYFYQAIERDDRRERVNEEKVEERVDEEELQGEDDQDEK